jgi:response regulator RpfG family c-di-GMP phosphodiesterase
MIAGVMEEILQIMEALIGNELIVVTKIEEAERLIAEDDIHLFVVGLRFDDSRATELVKIIRQDHKHHATPIVVLRLLASDHIKLGRQTLHAMKRMQTINDYLELEDDADAEGKIKAAVAKYLPAHKLLVLNEENL